MDTASDKTDLTFTKCLCIGGGGGALVCLFFVFAFVFAFVRTHPNLLFLWHKGRNF